MRAPLPRRHVSRIEWAAYLTHKVDDLAQIATGEHPSEASSERIGLVDISDHSTDASRAIKSHDPVADVKIGSEKFSPFYGHAYVPVFFNGRPVAVVAAYVDRTEQRDRFAKTFLIAAASLCALVALAFGIPAAA